MINMIELSREGKIDALKKMLRIRLFERKIEELFSKGEIYGTTHLYIGQEANAVGVCSRTQARPTNPMYYASSWKTACKTWDWRPSI